MRRLDVYSTAMIDKRALIEFARTYLTSHPEEVVRLAKNVVLLRIGVPLEALRFLASQLKGKKAPKEVLVEAEPPGLRLGATVNLMKTEMRVGVSVYVDRVELSPSSLRFELRVRDISLDVLGESESPVATLIKSGALDLSKPGNLVAYMPKRPAFLVEAAGDRIVLDLMQDPKLARKMGKLVGLVTPLISVKSVETDPEHLDIYLSCLPGGLQTALAAVRTAL